ncbi:MAG TPA: cupin domain-containing protein [Steroidobacteraceae bacterium]|nr:cupin domain-containing protein [Steroidobacteraceae bacterium]
MSLADSDGTPCGWMASVALYALHALPPAETADIEAHLSTCPECQREMMAMRPVVDTLASWPTDVLRPPAALWDRISHRLADETGGKPMLARAEPYSEPPWESVAPGIACKVLATDNERDRISMLVRLEPGAEYPPHAHAGVEELHLLYGELWVDDQKLSPGDYRRAEAGTSDRRVWSATGCTCVLITSTRDALY